MSEIKRIEKMVSDENYEIDYIRVQFSSAYRSYGKYAGRDDGRYFGMRKAHSPIKLSIDITKDNCESNVNFDFDYFDVEEFGKDLQSLGKLISKKYKGTTIPKTAQLPVININCEDDSEEPDIEEEDYNA